MCILDKKELARIAATFKLCKQLEKFMFAGGEEARLDKTPGMQIVYLGTPVRLRNCKLRETGMPLPKNILVSRVRMERAKRALWNAKKRNKAFSVLANSESGLKNCLAPDLTLGHKRSLLKSRLAMWECDEVYPFTLEELDAKIQEEEQEGFQQFLSNCLETPVSGVDDGIKY